MRVVTLTSNDCSRPTVTVDTMASYTRRAHSGGNGPALRQPRTAQSRAGHSAQEGPYTPQESRSRHASHKASNSHRAPNRKKKNTGKGKHRVLKWVLGIFFSLIGLGLLAGIAVFAYLYTTTEVPQPEKFALAEKTTVYYAAPTRSRIVKSSLARGCRTTSATRLWRPKTVRSTRIKALI